jgi:hypothetical protein
MKFFSVIFSYLSTSPLPSITTPQCNCVRPPLPNSISHVNSSQTPNSPCWPTFSSWSHLSYTLRDALIYGIPLGAVCYPSLPPTTPLPAPTSCRNGPIPRGMLHILLASITPSSQITRVIRCTRTARVSQAMCMRARKAVRRAHIRCMLQMRRQPRKSVWVSSGLNKKNIRVVVKSTGHSITGCSVGAASLSIWTHYLRGISYISDFTPTSLKRERACKQHELQQDTRSSTSCAQWRNTMPSRSRVRIPVWKL